MDNQSPKEVDMFFGEYVTDIDQSNRLFMPVPYRDVMIDFYQDRRLIIVRNKSKDCLIAFPFEEFKFLYVNSGQMSQIDRLIFAHMLMVDCEGEEIQLDQKGRIKISNKLRDIFGKGNQALFTGGKYYFEIWAMD